MKILRKKSVDAICETAITSILIYAESFLHGEMKYDEYDNGVKCQLFIISKVGGDKWVLKANDIITKRIQEGTKEINYKLQGDSNGK